MPDLDYLDDVRNAVGSGVKRARTSAPSWLPAALTGTGAVLLIIGCLAPWADFFFGYPGKVTLGGFPGGSRLYPLVLAGAAPLAVLSRLRRRRAGLFAGAGALAIVAGNLFAIAKGGGGLGAVAWGAWVALAGGVLLVAGFVALPDDRAKDLADRRWPFAVEIAVLVVTYGLVLSAVVVGLNIIESNRFVSFLAFVAAAALVLDALGLRTVLTSITDHRRRIVILGATITAAAFPFTQAGSGYWVRVFASIGVFAAAAIGLNVVVGLAGLLDLGYVAFFGVGAYVGALLSNAALTTLHVHVPFLLVVVLGACIAAIFGVLIGAPTLRLRGDYLAIVTLGFGEIFRITANNLDPITRGPNGISGVPDLAVGSFDFGDTHRIFGIDLAGFANYYFAELLLLAVAILMFTRLNDSRIGRAWVAIREDETAALAMGVDTTRLKLLAFAIGAFLAGAAGTLNSHITRQVSPDSYTFLESILLLAAVVLGGMGTVPGALLGSTALFVIPEKLRAFQDKRLLIFGIALILIMRFRPEGLVPSTRRRREFREAADAPETVPQ